MSEAAGLDSETRTMLDDSIARFAGGGATEPGWDVLAGNGWLGLGLPALHGGYGAAIGDLLGLLRTAGARGWRLPLIQCLGEACGALLVAPPGPLRDRLLRDIAAGVAIAGLCAPDGDPPIARAGGESHRLDGSCRFLIGGALWDHVLVAARCADSGATALFAIDGRAPGLHSRLYAAIDGSDVVDIALADVPATLLGPAGKACAAARRRALILAAAEAQGLARAALDATCAHLAQRRQFGQPIIRFQAIRHRLVDLHIQEQELGAMLEAACALYDTEGPGLDEALWRLRAQSAATALSITAEAIQLHGGMGMTCELPIGLHYARALLLDGLFGSYREAIAALAAALPSSGQGPRP